MFNFFAQLAIIVVSSLLSNALRPKVAPPKPAGIEDVDAPTAEEGKPIPVVFGTVWITSPNLIWYGDLRTTPITKKGGKK